MSTVDEVKSRIDIVDLVGSYVALQRAGRNFRAPCPFHSERTPSFYVSPERQTWHCFGACATGGDCFAFIMKRENVEFSEALRVLAERAGVALGERRGPQEDERWRRLLDANEQAAAFFHNALLNAAPAQAARRYLEERGLNAETIEAFQLGYSYESWDALKSHLAQRGFANEELVAAGLLVESDTGGYDRFRGRLMFPIRDERGRTVGFGARELDGGDLPGAKYINTPQTALFDKSSLLYAFDRAREAIRRQETAVVVEGYMDAIAAHQHGIENVVASMGTALTQRQIRMLERLRCKVLLALDADAAGMEATLRALQEAGEAGAIHATSASAGPEAMGAEEFSAKVQEWSRDALKRATVNFYVVPLLGKDPDEMIRADRDAWDAAVTGAKPFTEHVFDLAAGRRDLAQPEERAGLVKELLPVLRLIEEPVFQAHYVQRLARLAQVPEDTLRFELRRRGKKSPSRDEAAPAAAASRREPLGEFLLALLLRHPQLRAEGLAISVDAFLLGEHRAIFSLWRESPDIDSIRAALPEETLPQLELIMQRDLPLLDGADLRKALDSCVAKSAEDRLRQAKRASAAALMEPEVQPDMAEAVTQAIARRGSEAEGASPLATTLIEDEEMGRRLHKATSAKRSHPAPQDEAGDGS